MTVIGTLSHEFGHYSVARFLGYEARINYQSSWYWDAELNVFLNDTYRKHSREITNDLDFPGKERYKKVIDQYTRDGFWVTLGGPAETILTGTIGFILLIFFRRKIVIGDQLTVRGWTFVFITLFWLRQLANLFMALVKTLIDGKPSMRGDEMRLANALEINVWTIQIITGMISIAVLLFVIGQIPKRQIPTFLVSGLVGGISGYYLWLIRFGPVIMP